MIREVSQPYVLIQKHWPSLKRGSNPRPPGIATEKSINICLNAHKFTIHLLVYCMFSVIRESKNQIHLFIYRGSAILLKHENSKVISMLPHKVTFHIKTFHPTRTLSGGSEQNICIMTSTQRIRKWHFIRNCRSCWVLMTFRMHSRCERCNETFDLINVNNYNSHWYWYFFVPANH